MKRSNLMPMPRPEPTPEAPTFTFRGPWFRHDEACAYVGCRTMVGWYSWRKKHGIVTTSFNTVAKADIDRVLAYRKPKKRMAAASLANLRQMRGTR
jgi:hypothetical protein